MSTITPAKSTTAWAVKKVQGMTPRNAASRYVCRTGSQSTYGQIQRADLFATKDAAIELCEPGEIVVKVRVSITEVE